MIDVSKCLQDPYLQHPDKRIACFPSHRSVPPRNNGSFIAAKGSRFHRQSSSSGFAFQIARLSERRELVIHNNVSTHPGGQAPVISPPRG
uniref:Uncharacterized protein n=1 Tax=Steinernema glaseri TaxID=37863 RepID=A0A1I8AEN7_9BILA